jgi:hypothetical protein
VGKLLEQSKFPENFNHHAYQEEKVIEMPQFNTGVDKLNRRVTVERSLDDFLNQCLLNGIGIESHHEATKKLFEHYMSVVRSRNKVRRNWHREQARACDIETLELISKDEFQNSLDRRLREALVITTNGSKVITEESIQELVAKTADDFYKSNRKKPKPTRLEEIVRKILKANPEATSTDVINEMRSRPEEYGVVAIDSTHVVIREEQGVGKQTIDKPRSLATIKNILSRIKTPKS